MTQYRTTEVWTIEHPTDPALPFAWRCFRCGAFEPMYSHLDAAEADARLHERSGCEVIPL